MFGGTLLTDTWDVEGEFPCIGVEILERNAAGVPGALLVKQELASRGFRWEVSGDFGGGGLSCSNLSELFATDNPWKS
jgi:hypothetical protein